MTREEAIFVLECVEAHGLADDAKRMAIEALKADPQIAYEQGVKDMLDKYDETFRITSIIRTTVGCKTAKECWEQIRNGEIQRVKHGHWIEIGHPWYECSECGERTAVVNLNGEVVWNYCPNCGAKMDEVIE